MEIITRIALTATPSAPFLSPRPTQRPAAMAAASVTRTSSRARLRSGDCGATDRLSGSVMARTLSVPDFRSGAIDRHFGRLDAEDHAEARDQVELGGREGGDVGREARRRRRAPAPGRRSGSSSVTVVVMMLRGLPPGGSRKTETALGRKTATTASPATGTGSVGSPLTSMPAGAADGAVAPGARGPC